MPIIDKYFHPRYSESEGLECTKAFYNNGLMRMKITPDGTKMVISTTNAYIMVIHDLCLETLATDLQNFKVSLGVLALVRL